jgi:hypothetical protein
MKKLVKISLAAAFALVCLIDLFFPELSSIDFRVIAGSTLTYAFALGAVVGGISEPPAGVLELARRWHGNIENQFSAIDNLWRVLQDKKTAWDVPDEFITELTGRRNRLDALISICKGGGASTVSREQRNALLKSTVGYCLIQVKAWVYQACATGALSADEVHSLGFLMLGETGGYHSRSKPTLATAMAKVRITQMDHICVIIDHAYQENAALVVHGWPIGVHNALIIILTADGKREIYRQMTPNLHTYIKLPKETRGKQFIVKAAFLKHVDDDPKFGPEPTFTMPYNTEDLADTLDQQHHEEFEEQVREIERQRQELERMQKEFDEKQKQ